MFFLAALTFYGCRKSNTQDSGIYITDPLRQGLDARTISVDDAGGSLTLSASASTPVSGTVEVVFEIDTTLIAAYNEKNHTNFKALPRRFYSLAPTGSTAGTQSSATSSIVAGASLSGEVTLHIFPLDNTISDGDQFMVPVKIASTSGDIPLIRSSSVVYAMLGRVLTNPALRFRGGLVDFAIRDPLVNLTTWTLEFRMLMTNYANNALFVAGPSEIFVRMGDPASAQDELEVKYAGMKPYFSTRFALNRWYHIAIVFDGNRGRFATYVDGVQDYAEATPPGASFNLETMRFGGSSSSTNTTGQEVRFWTRALSQAEIRNGMCAIDPSTPGLYGYWKFNEGRGVTVADVSGNGHNGVIGGGISWVAGIRCPN